MDVQYNGEKVCWLQTDRVMLSMDAVDTIRGMIGELEQAYGKQEFEESYWLKQNGYLMFKCKGEIEEAIGFCSISPNHWNLEGRIQ